MRSRKYPTLGILWHCLWTSLVAQMVKRLSTMREIQVRGLGWEDPLEKEMAIHSSTIAWKIPWTEEPGRLQSMGSQRVGHDWATSRSCNCNKDQVVRISDNLAEHSVAFDCHSHPLMFQLPSFCCKTSYVSWLLPTQSLGINHNGKEYLKRMYIHMCLTESLCCTAETGTTL